MKKIKTKTWLPVFPGFYETGFDWDSDFLERVIKEDWLDDRDLHPWMRDFFDFMMGRGEFCRAEMEYRSDICKACCEVVSLWLKDAGIGNSIAYEGFHSPREYNFYTDAIDCEITIEDPAEIEEYLKTYHSDFEKYIKDRYTDRSGFMSYYSNDVWEWRLDLKESLSHDHKLGSILEFICRKEGLGEWKLHKQVSDAVDNFEMYLDIKELIPQWLEHEIREKENTDIAELIDEKASDGVEWALAFIKELMKDYQGDTAERITVMELLDRQADRDAYNDPRQVHITELLEV